MGKQETLGFVLIGLVLIVWMWLQAPPPVEQRVLPADTLAATQTKSQDLQQEVVEPPKEEPKRATDSLGSYFSHLSSGIEKVLIIKTDLYTAEVTTRGGLLRKWELSAYETWDGYPVQMVDPELQGDLSLVFLSTDGREINTRSLYFSADFENRKEVQLPGTQSYTVTLVLQVSPTQRIVKKLTFRNGSYACEAAFELENMSAVIANFEYHVTWETGVRYAEHNSIDESGFAMAYAYAGGELAEVDATAFDETAKQDINGVTSWIAARNKYFAVALVPTEGSSQGAYIEGRRAQRPDGGAKEEYRLGLKMPFKGMRTEGCDVTVFLGPLDFDVVKSYGKDLDKIISLGAAWIIRPISEYVMIPLFQLIHFFIPNYGVVIIVFSVIIKIVLHPLSKSSMKSMKRMQALQPMMNEIREKHKDDPQKMNQQVMNLYKEYGVNPAAGCLPLLLQMPILFALYSMFQSSIALRQANFVGWIRDLSVPDVAFKLPFSLPLIGITDISGLAFAMGITMFVQQKMTITDPRQKAMVWMMPVMMTLIFNGLPAGLNLYYFIFNVLSIAQQMWLKKTQPEEPLRKVERKKGAGGFLAKIAKEMPNLKK